MIKNKPLCLPRNETCPINKIMKKLNDDEKDSSRLKLNEKDIFETNTIKPIIKKGKKRIKKKRIKQ